MAASASPLNFPVRRKNPVLVTPAKPRPREFLPLSDIDDQEGLRFHIPVIHVYRQNPSMLGRNPVEVIRDALAKALVHYYPLAGRLREIMPDRKLVVDCNGEGVLFIEADANVRLEQFGDALQPPFPCLDELLFNVEGSDGVTDCPLVLIQVTRLLCGGFIFALRLNHTMSDAQGLVQFMSAIADFARGETVPAIMPVWAREFLFARSPPRPNPSCIMKEYDNIGTPLQPPPPVPVDMVHRSFFFGPAETSALKSHLPPYLRNNCSTFEILTACIWRSRTIALEINPNENVRMICIVSGRGKLVNPPVPEGYYGNTFVFPSAVSNAGELCSKPVGYALELIKKAKSEVNQEYMQSVADTMVLHGRPHFNVTGAYLVSDVTRAGFHKLDFGWGRGVYGGPATAGVGPVPGLASFYVPSKNSEGVSGVVVPVFMPAPAMQRFAAEIERLTSEQKETTNATPLLMSSL